MTDCHALHTPLIEIFWTGGFDSTFRMLQLSKIPITIQPYYCSDNRQSEQYELNAIASITKALSDRKTTLAEIKPPILIPSSARIQNEHITSTWKKVRETDFFGSQYDWLTRLATEHPGIELSIHKDDKAILLIEKYAKLKRVEDNIIGPYYILDLEHSSEEMKTLFQNYHFPLANYTKLEMKEEYKLENALDIMEQTWFCFTPIDGRPCGICNPCKYAIEEGMKERFTAEALKRYRVNKRNQKVKRIINACSLKNLISSHMKRLH